MRHGDLCQGFQIGFGNLASSGRCLQGFRQNNLGASYGFVLVAFPESLRCLVHGSFVGHNVPHACLSRAFQKSSSLFFDGLNDGFADQEFRVFGTCAIERTVATNEASVPLVAVCRSH